LPVSPDETPVLDGARISETAVAWHLRQDDMTADDWSAFVLWIEADPEHARVYDAVARRDRLLDEVVIAAPADDNRPLQSG